MMAIQDVPLQAIDGRTVSLADWAGQVLLLVNVASQCGLTPQYAALQALHERFAGRGFQVLGFPCNDFAGQEPGTEAEIQAFCESRFNVSFPLFAKLSINGKQRHPLYAALIAAQPEALPSGNPQLREKLGQHGLLPKSPGDVLWNFEKFLVDRDGCVVARFAPDMAPDDARQVAAIERALG